MELRQRPPKQTARKTAPWAQRRQHLEEEEKEELEQSESGVSRGMRKRDWKLADKYSEGELSPSKIDYDDMEIVGEAKKYYRALFLYCEI